MPISGNWIAENVTRHARHSTQDFGGLRSFRRFDRNNLESAANALTLALAGNDSSVQAAISNKLGITSGGVQAGKTLKGSVSGGVQADKTTKERLSGDPKTPKSTIIVGGQNVESETTEIQGTKTKKTSGTSTSTSPARIGSETTPFLE